MTTRCLCSGRVQVQTHLVTVRRRWCFVFKVSCCGRHKPRRLRSSALTPPNKRARQPSCLAVTPSPSPLVMRSGHKHATWMWWTRIVRAAVKCVWHVHIWTYQSILTAFNSGKLDVILSWNLRLYTDQHRLMFVLPALEQNWVCRHPEQPNWTHSINRYTESLWNEQVTFQLTHWAIHQPASWTNTN